MELHDRTPNLKTDGDGAKYFTRRVAASLELRRAGLAPIWFRGFHWTGRRARLGAVRPQVELPRGTVTLLFSDIEGSTRIAIQLRDRYGDVLSRHHQLLRAAFEEHGGREIGTQGDAFFVAFDRAKQAVAAAVASQRALSEHDWPEGAEVKVRIGIHTSEPSLGADGYHGLGMHRAARICAAGHGGQILLSNVTRELIEDELSDELELLDLGENRLKDLDRPERIFLVLYAGVAQSFPDLKTVDGQPLETPFGATPGRPRTELHIDLLGGFRVAAGETMVDEAAWRLRKARGLVKLLALTPEHSLHRERAIEALWPDRDPSAASNNLRQALFVARRALDSCGEDGAARITLVHDVLALAPDGLRIDVEVFEAAAAEAERSPSVDRYRAAIGLYGGELLPEDRFEGWAGARREALRERHLILLVDLARLYENDGDHAAAIAALQQALLDEPLHERVHRELMRIFALTGRRQRALAQFHLLRESLRREFEDEPDDDTRRLYQEILTRSLGAEGTAEPAPAPRRADPSPRRDGNLPLQLTSFVGRERELGEIIGLARRARLLTLTGPGGCGKTRLSLEAAGALLRDTPGGAWFVELAGLSDGALVPHAVGAVLGVESRSARSSEAAVAAHVGDRQLLVVLDNCEQVVGACARFAEGLLAACPNLLVLATSREPLHVAGEVNWRVPSLSPPEAERLFAERASGVSSRFELSEENAAAVGEICRRVDGIPLAIELAAARVGVLAPAQIAEHLRDSLAVLAAGRRTALTRQQTLTATLDWSHALLDEDERTLFRRLAVFAGSCDLEAVKEVCEGELDVLGRLVDKSLVVVDEQDGTARYRLLDIVRHYARDRSAKAGEQAWLEARHRAYYLRLAEELEPAIDGPDARRRLAREADELRRALRTALRAEPDLALRLAAALWRFWHDRGDLTEGARWLEDALAAAPEPSALGARALHGLSVLALRTSDHRRALGTAGEAVAFFRGSGDPRALGEELHYLGTLAWVFSDYDGAERWCKESRTIAEEAAEPAIAASVIHTLGVIDASRNDTANGREAIARSIELLRALPEHGEPLLLPVALGYGRVPRDDDRPPRRFLEQTFVTARRVNPAGAVAYALCDLAAAARYADDLAVSRALLEESLSRFRRVGDDLGAAQALAQLGNLLCAEGEHELARDLHEESLAVREAANDARGIGLSLLAIAVAAARAAEPERAWASAKRARDLFDRTDDGPGRASAVMQLGYLAADAGRSHEARELQELALALWRDFIPHSLWCAAILLELADLDGVLGEPERVPDRLERAIEIFARVEDRVGLAYCEQALRVIANAALTQQ
jgi:predicted ATPase/DNA-binding SARP family transcriptional activator/class 3 adenylate cyclase